MRHEYVCEKNMKKKFKLKLNWTERSFIVGIIATFTINYCYVDSTMCHAMKSVKIFDINLF